MLAAISLNDSGHVGNLVRPRLGGSDRQVAVRERNGGVANVVDRSRDRAGKEEAPDHRDRRRRREHGEDLHVVAHVEHDPAGEENDGERETDGEGSEPHELQAHRRERSQPQGEDQPDAERDQCDAMPHARSSGQGTNR